MGNGSSKHGKKSSNDQFQSYPSFSKSDTIGSTKSIRSIRSRMSSLSNQSEHGSFRTASEEASANGGENSVPIEQKGDGRAEIKSEKGAVLSEGVGEIEARLPNTGNHTGTPNELGSGVDEYPFPNNSLLPKSMQYVEPMEPILIRRDKDGNISMPTTPANNTFADSVHDNGAVAPLTSISSEAAEGTPKNEDATPAATATPIKMPHQDARSPANSPKNLPTPSGTSIPKSDSLATPVGTDYMSGSPSRNRYFPSGPNTPSGSIPVPSPVNPYGLNFDEIIQKLLDAGYSGKTTKNVCLKNQEIAQICQLAREIFLSQPTLLELSTPVKIVGDVHGQYGDLIRMFEICGFPPASNYLFLGDYVDRGKQSLETILLLLCYKIKYPENFFLLRGNHECANVTRVYGFFDECKRRCNNKTWKTFIDTFNALPIAAVVAQKIFCVHGGLSPTLYNLNDIRMIERPTDVPDYGLLNDLLWSDPADTSNEWEDNERGVSYCFNKVAINKFLARFGFDLVCRAHMVVEDGYEFFNDKSLVTVFSAPNYCGEFDNWGAVMSVSEDLLCTFELLKPLDSVALKQEMRRGRRERQKGLLASPSTSGAQSV